MVPSGLNYLPSFSTRSSGVAPAAKCGVVKSGTKCEALHRAERPGEDLRCQLVTSCGHIWTCFHNYRTQTTRCPLDGPSSYLRGSESDFPRFLRVWSNRLATAPLPPVEGTSPSKSNQIREKPSHISLLLCFEADAQLQLLTV